MRKTLATIALALIATTAQAADFQEVYQVKHSASSIMTAAGQLDQNIYCRFWGTTMKFQGNVSLEAKDGKYRLTFDKMRSLDSGVLLSDLPQTQKSCNKSMNKYANDLHAKISNWNDF